jgi:DNA sulfur modification protein DndB
MKSAEFSLPVIRGKQAGRAVYTAMVPLRLLPKLFPIGVDGTTTDQAQSFRQVNAERVREIARDIVAHRDDYHLGAIIVSVEQKVRYVPLENGQAADSGHGSLIVPLAAPLVIHDGNHRVFALQRALKECPALADDCVALLIHVDPGGKRRGQIFSDVKRHQRTAAQSLRIGHDDRDETAKLTRSMIAAVPAFTDAIELEKTTISNRSRKLFTLSALYQANQVLLSDRKSASYDERLQLATEFWTAVAAVFPDWTEITRGETSAAEIRASCIHCHAIGLSAIARAGRALLAQSPKTWKKRIPDLGKLDWTRSNKKVWEGRAMIGGRLSKSSSAVARAGNAVKKHLGLTLTKEEEALE